MHSVPSPARGASLIEVLVALFVLSVGLLGVAAMQQVGLRNSHSAHLRSQATALAYDVMDRMRANVAQARLQAYDSAFGASYDLGNCVPNPVPAQRVACDLAQWRAALARVLPGGTGSIDVAAPSGGMQTATVIVRWDDSRGELAPIAFRTMTQL